MLVARNRHGAPPTCCPPAPLCFYLCPCAFPTLRGYIIQPCTPTIITDSPFLLFFSLIRIPAVILLANLGRELFLNALQECADDDDDDDVQRPRGRRQSYAYLLGHTFTFRLFVMRWTARINCNGS